MSTEDEISDVENAKVSDGSSTAGDHNVEKVNDQPVIDKQGENEPNKQENDQVEEKTITINEKIEPKPEEPNEELTVV